MLRRILPLLIVALATIGLDATGGLQWLNDRLVEMRMSAAPRAATGEVAVVEIDAQSLAAIGQWPWPRSIHALIVDRLVEYGAAEVAFDVDFSSASDPAEDAAFEGALGRAGGSVVLSSFRQRASAAGGLIFTSPLQRFADVTWPGIVNVIPDADGRVRSLPYGDAIEGMPIPSLASLLGGGNGVLGHEFLIDFSIDANKIDRISAIELTNGTVDPARIRGKSLIVGASAVELRDFFFVPVQGILSGAVLQALGAETLRQDRVIATTGDLAAVLALLVVLAAVGLYRPRWTTTLLYIGGAAVGVELVAGLVQAALPLAITTAPLQAGLALLAGVTLVGEVNFRAILLLISRNETSNTQAILDRVVADNFAGVLVIDQDGIVLAASKTAATFLDDGHPLVGRHASTILQRELAEPVGVALRATADGIAYEAGLQETAVARGGARRTLEYVVMPSKLAGGVTIDGHREADRTVVCLTFRDVTDRRAAEARIAYLARFDTLTGLANRNHFLERLGRIEGADNTVVAISVDRFGEVNETFGHGVGDRLLRAVAERVSACLKPGDLLARLDTDTFVALLAGANAASRAEKLAALLIARVGEPYVLAGDKLIARLSVGIAGADRAVDTEGLLKAAEAALHRAGANGGNGFVVFDPAMIAGQAYRQVLEAELWEAFEKEQFEVYYQVQVDLRDGSVTGAEALVRWNHPRRGLVGPDEFIPLAEAIGLIHSLGEWVLMRACREAARWPAQLRLAVNVSPTQFMRGDLVASVQAALAAADLLPQRLEIEITESVFIQDRLSAERIIHRLHEIGVSCSLDDFGTGYSALAYLKRFEIDKVKLDRTFIVGIPENAEAVAIARAVGAMAQSLGIRLLAEGVEREEQVAFLRLLGFNEGQGYLFGKPMRDEELRRALHPAPDEAWAKMAT